MLDLLSEAYVIEIANKLENLANENGYTSSLQVAEFIYSFVGDIQYIYDIDGSGSMEYPKYPIEMLWEASGDLKMLQHYMFSFIEALNYDAMFMVGITKQSSDEIAKV